jgi:hypothetical protein
MTERDKICGRLAPLASLAVQLRYIKHASKQEYLLPEELLENAHDCIRRMRTIPAARNALSRVAVQAILDLEPFLVAITDESLASQSLVDNDIAWSAVRDQADRCLSAMQFDLEEWERKQGLDRMV